MVQWLTMGVSYLKKVTGVSCFKVDSLNLIASKFFMKNKTAGAK